MASIPGSPIPADAQADANRRLYERPEVARRYAQEDRLTRAEAMALIKYQAAVVGRKVLDLGVGAGRTTAYLAPLAAVYLGIDASAPMIEQLRTLYPGVPAQLGDMRDLTRLTEASFDLVFASNCVLDAVSHDDRLRTLRGLRRLLHGRGLLIFSSHNRAYVEAGRPPRLEAVRTPLGWVAGVVRWARRTINRRRLLPAQRFEADYAVIVDSGHDYRCLHYYLTADVQRRQLEAQGYEVLEVMDRDGLTLAPGDASPRSPWLLYVARPVAGPVVPDDLTAGAPSRPAPPAA